MRTIGPQTHAHAQRLAHAKALATDDQRRDYINAIQGVVVKILDRQKATGTKALYPGELEDLRGMVDLWVELLSTVTHREYFTAEERAQKKLQTVLRAKGPVEGVRIVEAA